MTVEITRRSGSGQWLGPGVLTIRAPTDKPNGAYVEVPFTAAFTDEPWLDFNVEVVVEAWANWHGHKRWKPFLAQLHLFARGDESGRPVPISPTNLRKVPVARLLREALMAWEVFEGPPWTGRSVRPIGREAADALTAPAPKGKPGQAVTDDDLRKVAMVYREAVAVGDAAPRKAVMRALHLRTSRAGSWVQLARLRTDPETGEAFLGPALNRRPGEAE